MALSVTRRPWDRSHGRPLSLAFWLWVFGQVFRLLHPTLSVDLCPSSPASLSVLSPARDRKRKDPPNRLATPIAVFLLLVWGGAELAAIIDPSRHVDPSGATPLAMLAASFLLGQSWKQK